MLRINLSAQNYIFLSPPTRIIFDQKIAGEIRKFNIFIVRQKQDALSSMI